MNLIEHKICFLIAERHLRNEIHLKGLSNFCYVLPSGRSPMVTFSSPLKSTVKFPLALMATRPDSKWKQLLIAELENIALQSIFCVDLCNKTEIFILLA